MTSTPTTPRMLYLIGQPGAGKSTLMAKLTAGYDRLPRHDVAVPHEVLYDADSGDLIGAEIGKRRPQFGGTDALGSTVIERAVPWIVDTPYPLLLAEGARLGNRRFIKAAIEGGYHVTLALLDHDDAEAWRHSRTAITGREQNPSWVRGRLTASRTLAHEFEDHEDVDVFTGHPDDLYPILTRLLSLDPVFVR